MWTNNAGSQLPLLQVMMMIGENDEECVNQEITGAVVSVRPRGDRLALWTRTANNQEIVVKVG